MDIRTGAVRDIVRGYRLLAEAVEAIIGGFVYCPICECSYTKGQIGGHSSDCKLGTAIDHLRGVGCE